MSAEQISVFIENSPGSFSDLCKVLNEHQISMRAMCLADSEDFGVVRMIVDDVKNVRQTIKDCGFISRITPVLAVEIEDRPGALIKILEPLGRADINVDYSYAFLSKNVGKAYLILRVSDVTEAEKVLTDAGIPMIENNELKELFESSQI